MIIAGMSPPPGYPTPGSIEAVSRSVKARLPDTLMTSHAGALKLAIEFAGADHILAGSDYPHQIGSIPSMLDAIAKLPVSNEERDGIRWRNAARLE